MNKKQSEILYLDLIPSNWREVPNKYLFITHSSKVGKKSNEYQLLSLTTKGIKEKDINASGGKVPDSYDNYQTVSIGDMVFCLFDLDVSAVFSGLSNNEGMITSAYMVTKPNKKLINELYSKYWFQYVFSNRYYMIHSKSIRYTVTSEMFGRIKTPVPPINNQIKIGNFLDSECLKIDKLIFNQEQQIEKLKQYKQSLITEVVTKGMKSNTQMKESGSTWLKNIPYHWEMLYPKSLFVQRKDKARPNDRQLTSSQQHGIIDQEEYMNLTGSRVVVVEKDFNILKHVETGDFVISMRSFQGGIEYSTISGCISSAYVMLKPISERVYEGYYRWLLKSSLYINAIRSTSNLVRDGQAMRYANFIQIWLPCPPKHEQEEIANYLDKKCNQINKLIAIKKTKVERLKKYKSSLIYEYVTGKKEVE